MIHRKQDLISTEKKPRTRRIMLRATGWFTLLWSIILIAIGTRYLGYVGEVSPRTWLYLVTTLLGHFSLIAILPWLLIFLPLSLITPRRTGVIAGIVWLVSFCFTFILLVDVGVFEQYRFHLNGFVWDLLRNAGSEIFSFSWYSILLAFLISLIFCVLLGGLIALTLQIAERGWLRGWGITAGVIWFVSALISQGMHAWYEAQYEPEIPAMTHYFPMYDPVNAKRMLQGYGLVPDRSEEQEASLDYREGNLKYPLEELNCTPEKPPMNILIVVIDSARFDMFTPDITPTISKFAARPNSISFNDHHSGGNVTRDGIFSLFYGLPSTYWNDFAGQQLPPVLIQESQRQDYQMGIFGSATLISPAFDRTVFSGVRGVRTKTPGGEARNRDRQITKDWLQFVEDRDPDRPFFGFLFYDAVHHYDFPDDYPRLFQPVWERVDHISLNADFDPLPYFNRYKTSLHFTDSLVAQVIEQIERKGLDEETIIIVTSDHGEEFNDHGMNLWGHGSNFTAIQTQVPLVLHWPGREPAEIDYRTSHYDLAPTLLREIFGCTTEFDRYSTGESLFDPVERPWLIIGSYVHFGIVQPHRIIATQPVGGHQIVDLENRPIRGERLDATTAREVLDAMSRFHR